MSINLLALANQTGKTLHNKKNKNYASGTTMGNKIPGTKIPKNTGLTNLANKGRRGDTKIRNVDGEPSHVNSIEASVIDSMGPMGEAWVKTVGSGTINPQTGLKEYGFGKWLKKRVTPPKAVRQGVKAAWNMATSTTWKPSEGKWGIFGQTKKSKARDLAKQQAKSRHKDFEDFRREYENENIAGIMTEDTEDDTNKLTDYTGNEGLKNLILNESGLNNPSDFISSTDIEDYTDYYDSRKETELIEEHNRQMEKVNNEFERINNQRLTLNTGNEAIGDSLQSGLFGMLTQSNDTTAKKNFSGAGDFAAKFQKKATIKDAERQFEAQDDKRKDLDINEDNLLTDVESAEAALESGVKDLQDDYNQEFWNNMVSWDSAINA